MFAVRGAAVDSRRLQDKVGARTLGARDGRTQYTTGAAGARLRVTDPKPPRPRRGPRPSVVKTRAGSLTGLTLFRQTQSMTCTLHRSLCSAFPYLSPCLASRTSCCCCSSSICRANSRHSTVAKQIIARYDLNQTGRYLSNSSPASCDRHRPNPLGSLSFRPRLPVPLRGQLNAPCLPAFWTEGHSPTGLSCSVTAAR